MISIDSSKYDQRHGGAFDRGAADSYYNRGYCPHMYEGATYSSRRIGQHELSVEDLAAYAAGYEWNEQLNNKKSYD